MKRMIIVVSLLAVALFAAGCGDGASGAAAGGQDVAVIHLTGNDQMQYDKTEFTVESGQTVRLILEHVGTLPEVAMGHNVVILQQDESYEAFGSKTAAEGSIENDYLPPSMLERVIAHTELIGGGEKTQIEFTAPAPGKYPYLCTFPGHFIMMNGTMIVQ